MERKLFSSQNLKPRSQKLPITCVILLLYPPSNVIFPFWFVDKSALAYRSSSWTNLAISMQMYRFTLVMYRYNFTTVNFLHMCTGTHLCCTGTMCPLPLFMQGVPVHMNDVPVHLVLWCFPCIAGVPETSSIVCPHP